MKSLSIVLPLLLLLLLPGCSGFKSIINPYEENFKCRTKDDAGKCIDTPSAYKEARFPDANNADEMLQPAQTPMVIKSPAILQFQIPISTS